MNRTEAWAILVMMCLLGAATMLTSIASERADAIADARIDALSARVDALEAAIPVVSVYEEYFAPKNYVEVER